MKVLILAGGIGSRLEEETVLYPKPMVQIGGKPIIWHIMKHYSAYGFNDFIVLLGYKGYFIKEYFANYFLHQSDITIDVAKNNIEVHKNNSEEWKITLIDTGLDTMTGGRIKRVAKYLNNESFLLTYGDGVSDVDIRELVKFHKKHKKLITVTSVQPEARFGILDLKEDNTVSNFSEKVKTDSCWINGGFFVCEPEVLDYIDDDSTIFEKEPLKILSEEEKLCAYKHYGFWKCMDTLRDKKQLESMWSQGDAKWIVQV